MKYLSIACLTAAVSLGSFATAKAQGESDPGMGNMGLLRTASNIFIDDVYENNRAQLNISHTFAKGDRDAVINIPRVTLRIPVADVGYFEGQMHMYTVQGDVAKVYGLGDMQLSYTHILPDIEGFTYQFTGGLQIGMGTAALADGKGRPLPMAYQSNSGTTDVVLGASITWQKYVSLAVGYQQPFVQYNQNQYRGLTVTNEAVYSNKDYPFTRNYYRNGDLMMRLEGSWYNKRLGISGGPLMFYHLRNDLYEDVNNKFREIEGSEGLTVNLAANIFYRLGRYGSWKIDVSGGVPVVNRDVLPDGSARQWVITPGITYFFNQEYVLFN
jgi:hypothetical protein